MKIFHVCSCITRRQTDKRTAVRQQPIALEGKYKMILNAIDQAGRHCVEHRPTPHEHSPLCMCMWPSFEEQWWEERFDESSQ